MKKKETLSVAGWCVMPKGPMAATVVISLRTGLIVDVKDFTRTADIIAKDLICPGSLDLHTHVREDASRAEVHKEDFVTGGLAAINGGVVHIAEMGNNPVPPIDDASYDRKMALAEKCPVPVTLYAMTGPDTHPLRRKAPYKWCHARTTGANNLIFFPDRSSIEKTALRYQGTDGSHHAEDAETLKEFVREKLHELRRPPEAEIKAIDWSLYLIKHILRRGKICHCSVGDGLDRILAARRQGVKVVFELAPHHFLFNTDMITDANRALMQMNPPLRSPKDQLRCLEVLRGEEDKEAEKGVIFATDHAPHCEFGEKILTTAELEAGKLPASGQPHLDTYGNVMAELMVTHHFSPERVAQVCSSNPAAWLKRFLGPEYGKGYGRIAVGYMGSLTLIDRNTPHTVSKSNLKTKCAWSPFEGRTFPGSVQATIVKGKVLKLM